MTSAIALACLMVMGGCEPPQASDQGRRVTAPVEAQANPEHLEVPRVEPIVRVRIRRIEPGHAVNISAQDGQLLANVGDHRVRLSGPGRVTRGKGRWHLGGTRLPSAFRKAQEVELHSGSAILVEQSDGSSRAYPGIIRLVAADSSTNDGEPPNDTFEVINAVPMAQYIPGVLAGELYAGWSDAAFEAQAVAARSFAISECNQRRHRAWDVLDTPASQVYLGVTDHKQAHETAKRTAGRVLTWKGRIVPGYFSSCCGGRAATGPDAIGPNPVNDIPPLEGHGRPPKCDQAPVYRWSRTWETRTVTDAVRAWGRRAGHDDVAAIDRIVSMRPRKPNRHGRPTVVELEDRRGARIQVECIDLSSVLERAGLEGVYSGWIAADGTGDTLDVTGRGFGHGVGLCQYGAQAMGEAGSPYERILRFYFPGAEITKAW